LKDAFLLTKGSLSAGFKRTDNRSSGQGPPPLISGCPVDFNIFYCVMHYAPELILIAALALVGVAGVAMHKSQHR
jgi:hypothetical protein